MSSDDYDVFNCIRISIEEPIKIHELLNVCGYKVIESEVPTFDDNITVKYPTAPKVNLRIVDVVSNKDVFGVGDDICSALNDLIKNL